MKFINYVLFLVTLVVPIVTSESNTNTDQTPEATNIDSNLRSGTSKSRESPLRRLFFWSYYSKPYYSTPYYNTKPHIFGLELYDTYTNVKLLDLSDGGKIDLSLYKSLGIFSLSRLNIRAVSSPYTQSIKYDWNNILLRISSSLAEKYKMCGNDNYNYKYGYFGGSLGCTNLSFLNFGRNCITATPFNSVFALGDRGDAFNLCFDVTSGPAPVPPPVRAPVPYPRPVPVPVTKPAPVPVPPPVRAPVRPPVRAPVPVPVTKPAPVPVCTPTY